MNLERIKIGFFSAVAAVHALLWNYLPSKLLGATIIALSLVLVARKVRREFFSEL